MYTKIHSDFNETINIKDYTYIFKLGVQKGIKLSIVYKAAVAMDTTTDIELILQYIKMSRTNQFRTYEKRKFNLLKKDELINQILKYSVLYIYIILISFNNKNKKTKDQNFCNENYLRKLNKSRAIEILIQLKMKKVIEFYHTI